MKPDVSAILDSAEKCVRHNRQHISKHKHVQGETHCFLSACLHNSILSVPTLRKKGPVYTETCLQVCQRDSQIMRNKVLRSGETKIDLRHIWRRPGVSHHQASAWSTSDCIRPRGCFSAASWKNLITCSRRQTGAVGGSMVHLSAGRRLQGTQPGYQEWLQDNRVNECEWVAQPEPTLDSDWTSMERAPMLFIPPEGAWEVQHRVMGETAQRKVSQACGITLEEDSRLQLLPKVHQ